MSDRSLKAERDRYIGFSFAAADLLIELDDERRIVFAAGGCKVLTGHSEEEVIGRSFFSLLHERETATVEAILARLATVPMVGPCLIQLAGFAEPAMLRAMSVLKDGLLRVAVSRLPVGSIASTMAYDEATGVLDRKSFIELAERHLMSSRATGTRKELNLVRIHGLEALDLDNSTSEVTALLRSMGGLLRSLSVDGNSAGLLGDGSFGVVTIADAEDIDESVRGVVSDKAPDLSLSVETNALSLSAPVLSPNEASRALVHVLKSCAGRIDGEFAVNSLGEALRHSYRDTAKRIAGFRRVVRGLEFDLVYQPIVDLEHRRAHHWEALSRFHGWGSPYEVVSFAENVGITTEFDLAVVRKVLEYLSSIDPTRGRRPKVAVNVSTRSLEQDGFMADLGKVLSGAGRLAQSLSFEITESAEIENLERMAKIVASLRGKGYKVGLDDFGAGASAFHYIRALDVDLVKVDGGYVRNLLADDRDASIVRAMTKLCKSLGVTTVAEMIETEDQAAAVRSMGVDLGQGWLFGKPMADLVPDFVAPQVMPAAAE